MSFQTDQNSRPLMFAAALLASICLAACQPPPASQATATDPHAGHDMAHGASTTDPEAPASTKAFEAANAAMHEAMAMPTQTSWPA